MESTTFGWRSGANPKPGRGQVLMRVRAVGVCGSDVVPTVRIRGVQFTGTTEF